MLRDLVKKVRTAIDPSGPLGSVLSPSEVYKERQGWRTTAAPHVQRVVLEDKSAVEAALAVAPVRFVSAQEAIDVPKSRQRQVSAFVTERWEPVYAKTASTDLFEILKASETLVGWNVSQHSIKETKRLTQEDFREIVQTCQIQATDEWYNGILETVPGNDPIILEGEILRGQATYDEDGRMTHDGIVRGTMITHGRREYRERTKGFAHVDKGFMAEREKAQAEMDSRPVQNVRRAMEAVAGESLPMWRPTGINYRRDRRSAV